METNKENTLNFIIEQQEDKLRVYEKEILKLIYEKCLLEETRDNLEKRDFKIDEKNQFIKDNIHIILSMTSQIENCLNRKITNTTIRDINNYVMKIREKIELIMYGK